jgi:paraquat-inducible protein A
MSVSELDGIAATPILACPDCGLEQNVPLMRHGRVAICHRCDGVLERRSGTSLDAALAIASTGLLLLVPANVLPLMQIRMQGLQRSDWLISGSEALWAQGYRLLGLMVGVFSVAMPPVWLTGLVTVLFCVRLGVQAPWLGPLLRWVSLLRSWAMADVFLVGSFVAYSRLQDYAAVDVALGGFAFIGMALAALAIEPALDRRRLWAAIGPDTPGLAAPTDFACESCDRRCDRTEEGKRCMRCRAVLHRRRPDAMVRATALIIAGYLLYLPANLLPIMTVVRFGRPEANTILSGVKELIDLDLWPLAIIVLLASILIPLIKLAGMTWFLIEVRRGSAVRLVLRTRLYRFIEIIGRWSNIDVFMISILAALVQFGELSNVRAEPGAVAFAGVVVVTMFASHSFDPRLMWDAADGVA